MVYAAAVTENYMAFDTRDIILLVIAFTAGAALLLLSCVASRFAVCRIKRSESVPPLPYFRYAAFMLFGGVVALLVVYFSGLSAAAVIRIVFIALLVAVAMTDADTMEIPDLMCIAIAAVGIISIFIIPETEWWSRLIGVFCVSLPLTLIALLIPGAFGGGDIKLMAACGLFLGWRDTLLAAFIAILLGGIWGAVLLIAKKKKSGEHFAFGPFLCAGCAVCAFFGDFLASAFMYIFDFSRFF